VDSRWLCLSYQVLLFDVIYINLASHLNLICCSP
jgi:hypothetical protein